ncbi:hypothetical protein OJ998_29340 [Solirubrobacter taibaiensis]|nr:hypothetical protein [Solirubrobacter taibaiensis]
MAAELSALTPTYVFRIERAAADVEVAFSFYVDLATQQSTRVTEGPDGGYELLEEPVADVIYSGLIEALGIWPGTHPELEPGAAAPDPDGAIETTLVVMHHTEDGVEERELAFLDAGEEGVWLDGEPTTDYALYQALPLMLAFEDR